MDVSVIQKIGLALALGLLVGIQREWTAPHVAGLRTFAFITVLGTLAAMLAGELGPWLVAVGFLAVAAMIIVGDVSRAGQSRDERGLTTQTAAMVMYVVGVAIGLDRLVIGMIVGGGTAVLLQWKQPLHAFVKRIGEADIRAIFQLVLVALVILPVLPNRAYDPYGVLNPFEIWLVVVLIVGISLGGYIAYKFLGPRAGTLLVGILGGVISSTATTVSYSRRARRTPDMLGLAAVVIVISSTIVFVRVLIEVAVVAPNVLKDILPPLAAMLLLMVAISLVMYFVTSKPQEEVVLAEEPRELRTAVTFGLLYAAVLLIVAFAKDKFGNDALYGVAALSGLTDMDAITLSTAQMIKKGRLGAQTGWHLILIGALSNLVFKATAVAALGRTRLLRRIVLPYMAAMVGGLLILLFWP